jgi:uncharacterized membrane protein YccC
VAPRHGLSWAGVRVTVPYCCVLALASAFSYWIVTRVLTSVHPSPGASDLIGGLWAVISTLYVSHMSYQKTITAAVTRVTATFVSFVLCLIYLAFLPFHLWALALLVGLSALAVIMMGRLEDAIPAGIATAVVLVASELSPHDAWQQPILRFVDTVVGVVVGVAAAWLMLNVLPERFRPAVDADR